MASTILGSDADEAGYDARPRLFLSDDMVEALGIKGIPAPGSVFEGSIRVIAERVTAEAEEPDEAKEEGGSPDVSLCLIVTDIELAPAQVSSSERANMLYGKV